MNNANDKTVFVLDHTQYFGISGENLLDLDFGKSKGAALPAVSKSLWTCSVESSVEYCRIVWDLFPVGKLVKLFLFTYLSIMLTPPNICIILDSICG